MKVKLEFNAWEVLAIEVALKELKKRWRSEEPQCEGLESLARLEEKLSRAIFEASKAS